MDQLTADAIPFPLNLPGACLRVGETFRLKRTGQKEGIGDTAGLLFFGLLRPGQGNKCGCRGLESPHQPLHHKGFLQRKGRGQSPADQTGGHADAKAAGEQLVDNEMAFIRQGLPKAEHSIGLFVVLQSTDRRQQVFHPPVQRLVRVDGGPIRRLNVDSILDGRPEQADRFGGIANLAMAVSDQPFR